MTGVVPTGTVVDTTGDPAWSALLVAAIPTEPIVGLATNPLHLDGPLSWAKAEASLAADVSLPPVRDDWTVDLALPLATWTRPAYTEMDPRCYAADGTRVWGWACSRAEYDVARSTAVEVRRRPPVEAMSRLTPGGKYHAGLGPLKARDQVQPAEVVTQLRWWALGLADEVAALLEHVTHVGRMVGHGHGAIREWRVEVVDPANGAWQNRMFPAVDGRKGGIRAPYWHKSRETLVSAG